LSIEDNQGGLTHVMIVDNEEGITSPLKKGLEKYGFEVTTFNDPVIAPSHFRETIYYDMILLDIKMAKMDGLQLYQLLQRINSKVKIYFMIAFEVYYDALKELFPDSFILTYALLKSRFPSGICRKNKQGDGWQIVPADV
jgi:two-component SAPR family response regulator